MSKKNKKKMFRVTAIMHKIYLQILLLQGKDPTQSSDEQLVIVLSRMN